jgi:hypothetical protein
VGNREGNRPLGTPGLRREDNIKWDSAMQFPFQIKSCVIFGGKIGTGAVLSENVGFPRRFSFHQLLLIHHSSYNPTLHSLETDSIVKQTGKQARSLADIHFYLQFS